MWCRKDWWSNLSGAKMIDIQNLQYTYPGNSAETIHGLDFHIEKGEIFGFLGPSGAGKSTTQKIIIGILKQYRGQVQVFGQELRDLKNDYYEKIGVEFEFPNLYSKLTALENLKFFRSLYSDETENPMQLLEMVGLNDDADTRVSGFSKGMKMRLNFVRALLNKPEILFLDEPTAGLDPVNAKNIKNIILQKRAEGRTIFLTTHNMTVADEVCDRVAFIVEGSINLIDSPRELKIRNGKKNVRVEYREKGSTKNREFEIQDIGNNREFLNLLKSKEIETIHTQEATLEDIFIEVTGRSLK
jgi:fluoroquinolone transport system ATP-binding protein